VAICTHPERNHVFALEDFDVPSVATWTVVEGVEAYDPELGGEPLDTEELPEPIPMTYTGVQDPPAKKKGTGSRKGSKKTAKKTAKKSAKKTAKKTASRRSAAGSGG